MKFGADDEQIAADVRCAHGWEEEFDRQTEEGVRKLQSERMPNQHSLIAVALIVLGGPIMLGATAHLLVLLLSVGWDAL